MKKILIIDDEKTIHAALTREPTRLGTLSTLVRTSRIEAAIPYIQHKKIDLVLLRQEKITPRTIQLISFLDREKRDLPFILATDEAPSRVGAHLRALNRAFFVSDRPKGHAMLPQLVETCLDVGASGFLNNMPLENFLQILSAECKNCRLKLQRDDGKVGIMFLSGGDVVQSICCPFSGRGAAIEMASWTGARIDVFEGCPLVENDVGASTGFLVMEGCRLRDEKREASGKKTEPEAAAPAAGEIVSRTHEIDAPGGISSSTAPGSRPGAEIRSSDAPPDRRPDPEAIYEKIIEGSEPVIDALYRSVARVDGVKGFLLALDNGIVLHKKQNASSSLESNIDGILADIRFRGASTKYMRLRSHVIPGGERSDLAIFSLSPLNLVMEVDAGRTLDGAIDPLKPLIKRTAFRLRRYV